MGVTKRNDTFAIHLSKVLFKVKLQEIICEMMQYFGFLRLRVNSKLEANTGGYKIGHTTYLHITLYGPLTFR